MTTFTRTRSLSTLCFILSPVWEIPSDRDPFSPQALERFIYLLETAGLFIFMAGFVFGLGAVAVINRMG